MSISWGVEMEPWWDRHERAVIVVFALSAIAAEMTFFGGRYYIVGPMVWLIGFPDARRWDAKRRKKRRAKRRDQ